jgi:metal-responsive CopG/Arc/MetJ family transcriptional regulator
MARVKVMISIPEELLKEIDQNVHREHRTRSEFLREAAKLLLMVERSYDTPGEDPRMQRAVRIQEELAGYGDSADWNSTAALRTWRDRMSK